MAVKELNVHRQKGVVVLNSLHTMGFQPTLMAELSLILSRGSMKEQRKKDPPLLLVALSCAVPNIPGKNASEFDKWTWGNEMPLQGYLCDM